MKHLREVILLFSGADDQDRNNRTTLFPLKFGPLGKKRFWVAVLSRSRNSFSPSPPYPAMCSGNSITSLIEELSARFPQQLHGHRMLGIQRP